MRILGKAMFLQNTELKPMLIYRLNRKNIPSIPLTQMPRTSSGVKTPVFILKHPNMKSLFLTTKKLITISMLKITT